MKDDTSAADALLEDVQKQVHTLERYSSKPNHGMFGDEGMDQEGTKLWNLCTRLKRESAVAGPKSSISKLIMASRALAFQILHLCQWSSQASASIVCHLMKIALKAAKVCTGAVLLTIRLESRELLYPDCSSVSQTTTMSRSPD